MVEEANMHIFAFVLALVLFSSSSVHAEFFILKKPSYVERQLDTTSAPLMCSTVGLALDALQLQEKLPGCDFFTILAPCVRGYERVSGVLYSIMAIGPPGNQRFWYERGRIRTKKFCRA